MATSGSGSRLIFVGGAPRSGTTLVQNMLDSHPLVLGGPEFLHLPEVVGLRKILHDSISRGWIDIICSKGDVDAHLRSLIEKFFLPLAEKNKVEYYSEKSPMNILSFSELIELFPDSHFIHVIRDPRAIVSSMKKVKERAIGKGLDIPSFTRRVSASIAYVNKCFDAGFSAVNNHPEKVLTLVFENLLNAPEKETRRICDHLGIEWSDQMLHPGEKTHIGEQAITEKSGEIWYNAKEYYRDPDKQNVDKWKSDLSAREQIRAILAFRNRRDIKGYGYDFSLKSVTQMNGTSALGYFVYRWIVERVMRYSLAAVRKIPGISFLKKGLLAIGN